MATLKDVANHAGVSMTTVSRVYNKKGGYSTKTKNKVMKAMTELGFHPNEMARSLQGQNSNMIGLIVPYINHPIFSVVVDAVAAACNESDYRLILAISQGDEEKEKELFNVLKRNNVAGILFSTCLVDTSFYKDCNLPVVSIERTIADITSITCDNYMAGVKAADVLCASGAKNVLVYGKRASSWGPTNSRYNGFVDECKKKKINCTEVYFAEGNQTDTEKLYSCEKILEENREIDGVFTVEDMVAAMLQQKMDFGNIDRRLKIISCYDTRVAENFGITSVHHPFKEQGELAFETLINMLNKNTMAVNTLLPVAVVERKSTEREN